MKIFSAVSFENRLRFLTPYVIHAARSYCSRTHYQVLGVNKNATTDDIKTAFIQQSKKVHPDINKNDPKTHEKFVRLNEAYQVLSQDDSRLDYDNSLVISKYGGQSPGVPPHRYYNQRQEEYYANMHYKAHNQPFEQGQLRKAYPTSVVLCGIILWIVVGSITQFFVIRGTARRHIAQLDEHSRKNVAILKDLEKNAAHKRKMLREQAEKWNAEELDIKKVDT
ncbi:hypothetical protein SNE40_010135 [Patella caerulea]|uniref:J domain-containing protein n=1 Tax=Patella caerulea TaxID=87958 RepID=A0AAN8PR97_PATCE